MTSASKVWVTAVALAMVGLTAPLAHAPSENLLSDNSTFGAAQSVGPFTSDGLIEVFGIRGTALFLGSPTETNDDSNADFYSFDVAANQKLTLSVITLKGNIELNDPTVGLFSSAGLLLMSNDDISPSNFDSQLSLVITPGHYVAAVGGFFDDLDPFHGFTGGGATDFAYTLQMQLQAVPVPAAVWLLGSSFLGMLGFRRRAS